MGCRARRDGGVSTSTFDGRTGNCAELQFPSKLTITQVCCVLVLSVTVSCHGNPAMQGRGEGILKSFKRDKSDFCSYPCQIFLKVISNTLICNTNLLPHLRCVHSFQTSVSK